MNFEYTFLSSSYSLEIFSMTLLKTLFSSKILNDMSFQKHIISLNTLSIFNNWRKKSFLFIHLSNINLQLLAKRKEITFPTELR